MHRPSFHRPTFLALPLLVVAACADASPSPDTIAAYEPPSIEELTVKTAACMGFSDPLDAPGATLRARWAKTGGAYRARFEARMDCVAAATTCDAVLDCMDAEIVADCTGTCDGDVAVTCRLNTLALREDCASNPAGRTTCSMGYCVEPVCDTEMAKSCNGNIIEGCIDGRQEAIDCAQFGGTCGPSTSGEPTCVFDGIACGIETECNGDDLIACEMDKGVGAMDCSQLPFPGGTCASGSGNICSAPGATDPAACSPSCDGSIYTRCLGSISFSLDCSLMPGAQCGVGPNGKASCVML